HRDAVLRTGGSTGQRGGDRARRAAATTAAASPTTPRLADGDAGPPVIGGVTAPGPRIHSGARDTPSDDRPRRCGDDHPVVRPSASVTASAAPAARRRPRGTRMTRRLRRAPTLVAAIVAVGVAIPAGPATIARAATTYPTGG